MFWWRGSNICSQCWGSCTKNAKYHSWQSRMSKIYVLGEVTFWRDWTHCRWLSDSTRLVICWVAFQISNTAFTKWYLMAQVSSNLFDLSFCGKVTWLLDSRHLIMHVSSATPFFSRLHSWNACNFRSLASKAPDASVVTRLSRLVIFISWWNDLVSSLLLLLSVATSLPFFGSFFLW